MMRTSDAHAVIGRTSWSYGVALAVTCPETNCHSLPVLHKFKAIGIVIKSVNVCLELEERAVC